MTSRRPARRISLGEVGGLLVVMAVLVSVGVGAVLDSAVAALATLGIGVVVAAGVLFLVSHSRPRRTP